MSDLIYKSFSTLPERALLVAKICDAYTSPTRPRVREFLTNSGIDYNLNDIEVLLRLAKQETTRRVNAIAAKLIHVLPINPRKQIIVKAAEDFGVSLSDVRFYRRVHKILLSHADLWSDKLEVRMTVTFPHTERLLWERVSRMLGQPLTHSLWVVMRAFVIAVDQGLVDPVYLVEQARAAKDPDILRASAVFDRIDLKRKFAPPLSED